MSKRIQVRDRQGRFQWLTIGLGEDSLQYIPKSSNAKTGKVPAQFIGASREESEETCRICPLWRDDTCYAQDGSPQLGHAAVLRVQRRGDDRGIDQALENAQEDARVIRFGSIGDPGSIDPVVYDEHDRKAREYGFDVLNYTHQWHLPHAQFLKGRALASADNMKEDLRDAVDAGWRVAVHVDEKDASFNGKTIREAPQGTIKRFKRDAKGRFVASHIKYFLCPAQRTDKEGNDLGVTCNDCGLCDGTKPMANGYNTIVFVEHGLQMGFKKQRDERKESK